MIIEDAIVDEIQAIREKQASEYGFDIVAIIKAAKHRQNTSEHQVVSFVNQPKCVINHNETPTK
ncbi:MAG: hypothetical protein DRR16_15670 [Candidatus Parabeggiatoa sp. nov. 3]|nr:MAG: hypothetical protein DRR00_09555 [Gammaproteobacteria bacterium]RKZ67943.1 MAG: hypothetical protein DRQ99_05255 [Gammaproteobacteria bacterium]RKZ84089.1 MAG: hypothetical protein DRR16_15670 [Gammaproteobacteria bacterium]